jgi:hypothetical protein
MRARPVRASIDELRGRHRRCSLVRCRSCLAARAARWRSSLRFSYGGAQGPRVQLSAHRPRLPAQPRRARGFQRCQVRRWFLAVAGGRAAAKARVRDGAHRDRKAPAGARPRCGWAHCSAFSARAARGGGDTLLRAAQVLPPPRPRGGLDRRPAGLGCLVPRADAGTETARTSQSDTTTPL